MTDGWRLIAEIYTKQQRRVWPEGNVRQFVEAATRWIATPTIVTFDSDREAWGNTALAKLQSIAHEIWTTGFTAPDPTTDQNANLLDMTALLAILERVRSTRPPGAVGAEHTVPRSDPRNGDGWTDAVATDGVLMADDGADEEDLQLPLLLIEEVRGAKPPTGVGVAAVAPLDPRDGDGWTDAVARQGVRVPSYRDGYLESTHWELLLEERWTGTCVRCNRAWRTQLHHVHYRNLGAETEFDTRELCDRCHRREHPRTFQRAA